MAVSTNSFSNSVTKSSADWAVLEALYPTAKKIAVVLLSPADPKASPLPGHDESTPGSGTSVPPVVGDSGPKGGVVVGADVVVGSTDKVGETVETNEGLIDGLSDGKEEYRKAGVLVDGASSGGNVVVGLVSEDGDVAEGGTDVDGVWMDDGTPAGENQGEGFGLGGKLDPAWNDGDVGISGEVGADGVLGGPSAGKGT